MAGVFRDMACLASLASFLLLAGQEHGRTIALADVGPFQNAKLSRYDAMSSVFLGTI